MTTRETVWTTFGFLFEDAGSRFFVLHWLGAAILVSCYVIFASRFDHRKVREFFSLHYWWNASTRVDYSLVVLNAFFRLALAAPLAVVIWHLTRSLLIGLRTVFSVDQMGFAASPWALAAAAALAFCFDDALRYLHHRLMHDVAWLYPYHRAHHSATTVTPVTLLRVHPVEVAIAGLRNSISISVTTSVLIFVFGGAVSVFSIFGVNAFVWLFNFVGGQLRHSHFPISFGPLEWLFISPKQHQLHHLNDAELSRKNLGVSLAVWDLLAGSLVRSSSISNEKMQQVGFGARGAPAEQLVELLVPKLKQYSELKLFYRLKRILKFVPFKEIGLSNGVFKS